MTLRNLLLRAYPRSWRDEYGEELAGILRKRPLTPSAAADILRGAARQRLSRGSPWKICAVSLALWTCLWTGLDSCRLVTQSILWCYYLPMAAALVGTGARGALCRHSEVRGPGWRLAGVALAGMSPDILATLLRGPAVFQHTDGSLPWHQWGLYFGSSLAVSRGEYVAAVVLFTALWGLVWGFAGVFLANFLAGLREV